VEGRSEIGTLHHNFRVFVVVGEVFDWSFFDTVVLALLFNNG
jgi:hypothetical protein